VNKNGTGYSQICNDSNNDGICDQPYNLTTNNTDYLPLKYPFNTNITNGNGGEGNTQPPTSNNQTNTSNSGNCTISGNIYYPTNLTTGKIIVFYDNVGQLFDPNTGTLLYNKVKTLTGLSNDGVINYTIQLPCGNSYFIGAFFDLNGNDQFDGVEHIAQNNPEPFGFAINCSGRWECSSRINLNTNKTNIDIIIGYFNNTNASESGPIPPNPPEGIENISKNITNTISTSPECLLGNLTVKVKINNISLLNSTYISVGLDSVTEKQLYEGCVYLFNCYNSTTCEATINGFVPGEYSLVITFDKPPYVIKLDKRNITSDLTWEFNITSDLIPKEKTINVTVKDGNKGIPNADVYIYSIKDFSFFGYGKTDENGTAVIEGSLIKASNFTISVNYYDNNSKEYKSFNFIKEINESTNSLILNINDLPKVRGKVIRNGENIDGAFITIYTDDYSVFIFGTTNSSGEFEIKVPEDGEYNIRVEPGFSNKYFKPWKGKINTSSQLIINLTNNNTVILKGYVINSSGEKVGDIWIDAYSPETFDYVSYYVGSDGYYELELMKNEEYVIHLNPVDFSTPYLRTKHKVKLSESKELNLTIESSNNKLYGYVLGDNGEPINCSYACGWISVYDGINWFGTEVNESGYYELYLKPGKYTLEFYPYTSDLTMKRIKNVVVNGSKELNITTTNGFTLIGFIKTENNEKITDGDIYLSKKDNYYFNFVAWSKLDNEGKFKFKGLEEGEYKLEIYSNEYGYYEQIFNITNDTTITIVLNEGYVLNGTIEPNGSYDVYVYSNDYNNPYFSFIHTDNGNFVAKGLRNGDYVVYIYDINNRVSKEFNLSINGDINQTFNLGISGNKYNLTINVKDNETNDSLSNASVSIDCENSARFGLTNENGSITFSLYEGNCSISIYKEGYKLYYNGSITLNENKEIDISLTPLTVITQSKSKYNLTVKINNTFNNNETAWISIKDKNDYGILKIYNISIENNSIDNLTIELPEGNYSVNLVYLLVNGTQVSTKEIGKTIVLNETKQEAFIIQ
jgi:hypothetical protein